MGLSIGFFIFHIAALIWANRLTIRAYEEFEIHSPNEVMFATSRVGRPWSGQYAHTHVSVVEGNDIRAKSTQPLKFTLWNHRQWVACITVSHGIVKVNENYRLHGATVENVHITDNFRDLSAGVRVVLMGTGVLHRVDLHMPAGTWFSIFIFGRDITTVRPNGQYYETRMENAFNFVSARTLEFERRNQGVQFVIKNQNDASRLVERVKCAEEGTQTCQLTELVTMSALTEAITQAIENVHLMTSRAASTVDGRSDVVQPEGAANEQTAHEDAEGAQSLLMQGEVASHSGQTARKSAEARRRAEEKARQIRKENFERFGGLFDLKPGSDSSDANEE